MEMGMNVMKLIMEKCSQAQPILETIYSDGATPELAMQLLTIHQDLEKDFLKITGIHLAMFGEAGLQNEMMMEMMMQKGMEAFKTMMNKFSEKKKIMDVINTDGATPELAMQLLTATQDLFKTFMDITGLPTPMMKEKMTKMMEKNEENETNEENGDEGDEQGNGSGTDDDGKDSRGERRHENHGIGWKHSRIGPATPDNQGRLFDSLH